MKARPAGRGSRGPPAGAPVKPAVKPVPGPAPDDVPGAGQRRRAGAPRRGRRPPGKQPGGAAKTREVKPAVVWTAESCDGDGRPLRDPGSVSCVRQIVAGSYPQFRAPRGSASPREQGLHKPDVRPLLRLRIAADHRNGRRRYALQFPSQRTATRHAGRRRPMTQVAADPEMIQIELIGDGGRKEQAVRRRARRELDRSRPSGVEGGVGAQRAAGPTGSAGAAWTGAG